MNHSITQELINPDRYERALLRAGERLRFERNPEFRSMDGVDLHYLVLESKKIAAGLAHQVAGGHYELSPPVLAKVSLDKERVIHKFTLSDRIVTSVFSGVLRELSESRFSNGLYSYRAGRSPQMALQNFVTFLNRCPKESVYVLRRDVKNYTDTIPTQSSSPLWGIVDAHLGRDFPWKSLVKKMIAPTELGVPTGSSITPWVANVYLSELDKKIADQSVGALFYARFGDDVLIASPDLNLLKTSQQEFDSSLLGLGLEINSTKAKQIELCRNGFSRTPEFHASSFVEYLGLRVHRSGAIRLGAAKARLIINQLKTRLRRCARNLPVGESERLLVICKVVNRCLLEDSTLGILDSAVLSREVNDRGFLRELDHRIRRLVLSTAIGMTSVKGFRRWSPRELHEQFQLRSLEYSRNFRR